jgi:hypothetical protein
MARRVMKESAMRNAIMFGALALLVGAVGCHAEPPPNSPTPNADLQGEANNASQGLDAKSGSTVGNSGNGPADKAEKAQAVPAEKPAPEPAQAPQPPPPKP